MDGSDIAHEIHIRISQMQWCRLLGMGRGEGVWGANKVKVKTMSHNVAQGGGCRRGICLFPHKVQKQTK